MLPPTLASAKQLQVLRMLDCPRLRVTNADLNMLAGLVLPWHDCVHETNVGQRSCGVQNPVIGER